MQLRSARLALVTLTLLVACAEPRVDASNDERAKASIEKVRQSLPESTRARLDESIRILALNRMGNIFAAAMNPAGAKDDMIRPLNGKTADEIIAAADAVVAARQTKEREQAMKDVAELEAKRARSSQAVQELAKFKVESARFQLQPQRFGGPQPVIELKVENGTAQPVSRAYFVGTLSSPGRTIPWLKDGFNYTIPGGLELGENAEWDLVPNQFGPWGKIESRPDMVLTVELVRLDGADGKMLFDSAEFTEADAQRLAALESKFGVPSAVSSALPPANGGDTAAAH